MSSRVPARIRWAVDSLSVQPEDRVLEIGFRVTTELVTIRTALAPGGALCRFCEPPPPARVETIDRTVSGLLRQHGFAARRPRYRALGATRGVCIVGDPRPGAE